MALAGPYISIGRLPTTCPEMIARPYLKPGLDGKKLSSLAIPMIQESLNCLPAEGAGS
jgi:hypothetical protein